MEQAPQQIVDDDPGTDGDPSPEQPKRRIDGTKALLSIVILLLIGVLALQVIQLRQLDSTQEEVVALTEDVTDLKPLRRDVDILGDQVAALDGQLAAAVSAAGASPAAIPTQAADGSLPPFQDSANDAAVLGEEGLLGELLVGRFRHAEVDDLRYRSIVVQRDQYVRRFEVSMDDPLLVCVLYSVADRHRKLKPLAGRQTVLVTELRNRNPFYKLHYEIRPTSLSRAGVKDASNIGMIHQGQGLPLGLETSDHFLGIHTRFDDLDRNDSFDWLLLSRPPNRPHTAFANDID